MNQRAIAILSLCVLAAAHTGCATAIVALFQPENIGGETIVLATTDADGVSRAGAVAHRQQNNTRHIAFVTNVALEVNGGHCA